jgi:hypothetical protein
VPELFPALLDLETDHLENGMELFLHKEIPDS